VKFGLKRSTCTAPSDSVTPAVDDDGRVSTAKLHVHDAVDEWINARASPERQRRQHVDVAVKMGSLIGQVGDGERKVRQNEGEKHGEDHV